ncbi:MAG: anti-sigma factor [Halopseudomonas sp.]
MTSPVSEHDLHAYVDGLLEPKRQQHVKQWLDEHPDEAKKVEAYRQLNQELLLSYPLPEDNFELPQPAIKSRPVWLQAAIVAGFTLFGGISGWWLNQQINQQPHLIAQNLQQTLVLPARVSHQVYTPEVLHPVEVKHEQQKHLVGWLSKRLGQQIKAPNLTEQGFSLLGGRLLPASDGPAAQFMYESATGKRLTLYVRRSSEPQIETAFRRFSNDGLNSFYWVDNGLGYALTGDMDEKQLVKSANSVYHQLGF